MVVVVAVVISVFVLPGVTVFPLMSTHEALMCMSAVVDVVTRRRSDVEDRIIIRKTGKMEGCL